MEKYIVTSSYWLGVASAVIALVTRALNLFGMWVPQSIEPGRTVWYMSFYKGALLFLLISIATANLTWARSQKS